MAGCCSKTPHKQDAWWAWLVCLCAVISVTVTIGISNCFAVPLPVLLIEFKETKQRLGWLGSMATSITFLATPLAGFFSKRFGFRATCLVGCMTCAGGLVLTSFLNSVSPMFFSYGVLYGLGSCFLHIGSVFAVTAYFNKKRPFATGVLSSAHSIGFITFGPMMQEIIDAVGWRNMYRIMAALFGLIMVLVLSFDSNVENSALSKSDILMNEQDDNENKMDEKVEVKIQKQKFTLVYFKDPGFMLALICLTIGTFGTVVCFVHLIKYSEEVGISADKGANLFMIIGSCSLVASIVAGKIAEIKHVSPFHVSQFSYLVLAASLLLLSRADEYFHFAIFAVLFGLGYGFFATCIYLLLMNTVKPIHRIYAFPVGESVTACGALVGSPFAGFIADYTGSYVPALYTFASFFIFAFLLVFLVYACKLDKTKEYSQDLQETKIGDQVKNTPNKEAVWMETESETEIQKPTTKSNSKMEGKKLLTLQYCSAI